MSALSCNSSASRTVNRSPVGHTSLTPSQPPTSTTQRGDTLQSRDIILFRPPNKGNELPLPHEKAKSPGRSAYLSTVR